MCVISLRDLRKQTGLHERFRQEIIVSKQYKEHSQNVLSENIVLKLTEKQTLIRKGSYSKNNRRGGNQSQISHFYKTTSCTM